jgi:preprotein translocase subunit SecG
MNAQEFQAPANLNRAQMLGWTIGGIALVLGIVGAVISPEKFYHAYLTGYLLVLGLTLGSLGLLLTQHLTSGVWGIVIRRPAEAATRNIWLVAVMFIPIVLGMKYLYSGNGTEPGWLNAPKTGEHALSAYQQAYLTTHGYLTRAVLYFVIWFALVYFYNLWSRQQDASPDDLSVRKRFRTFAGPGIILYVLAMTFAAIDWVMSLSPHWASTIYGFIFVGGQLIASMCLMILAVVALSGSEPYKGFIRARHLHDLGKLLFAFNMLWAYFAFSQLLIIWSGNQPEEISFYRTRLYGQWGVVAVIVLLLTFALPFLILLSQDVKRNAGLISKVAIWMLVFRLVDLYWMTQPEFRASAWPNWLDIVLPVALIGLWVGFFAWNLKQRPVLPLGDPKLAEVLAHHEH